MASAPCEDCHGPAPTPRTVLKQHGTHSEAVYVLDLPRTALLLPEKVCNTDASSSKNDDNRDRDGRVEAPLILRAAPVLDSPVPGLAVRHATALLCVLVLLERPALAELDASRVVIC